MNLSCTSSADVDEQVIIRSNEFFPSRNYVDTSTECANEISFTIGSKLIDENYVGSNLYGMLNSLYETQPMEILCACSCNSTEIIQDFLNTNVTNYGYLEENPRYDLSCNEALQNLSIQCNNTTEVIKNRLNERIVEMLERNLLSPVFVNDILNPILDQIENEPENVDFCLYKERYNMLEGDLDVLQRISCAHSLMVTENIMKYYIGGANEIDEPEAIWSHVLGGLWGAYSGALTWALSADAVEIYGAPGQDCLGTNAGYGAVFGAIGGF